MSNNKARAPETHLISTENVQRQRCWIQLQCTLAPTLDNKSKDTQYFKKCNKHGDYGQFHPLHELKPRS